MNYIDVGIIIFIALLGFNGFKQGLIKSSFNFLGLLLGVVIASYVSVEFGGFIGGLIGIDSASINTTIGFGLIILLSYVWFSVMGILISKMFYLENGVMSVLNKAFGFIFVCGTSFLFLSFLVFFISKIDFINEKLVPKARANSQMYVSMINTASWIFNLKGVQDTIENMNEIIENPATSSLDSTEAIENIKNSVKEIQDKASTAILK